MMPFNVFDVIEIDIFYIEIFILTVKIITFTLAIFLNIFYISPLNISHFHNDNLKELLNVIADFYMINIIITITIIVLTEKDRLLMKVFEQIAYISLFFMCLFIMVEINIRLDSIEELMFFKLLFILLSFPDFGDIDINMMHNIYQHFCIRNNLISSNFG